MVDPEVDLFAREGTFIERVLVGLLGQSPGLEGRSRTHHDRAAPSFVPAGPERLAVSITSW
ncbi:MAG: hypothetical protein M3461_23830 [Pseudomonadota bacterium]|nr:hypothetical protein [Pseudomonadota bacterium]